jgi:hypothetical protein
VIRYDVSINADTGLAVPVNMVANEDGREVTVTVANSGPYPATGSVTVVGTGAATVNELFSFTGLAAGATQSWVFPVVAITTGTIDWTATVTAEFDVYAPNNIATATTTVNAAGGGEGE